MKLKEFFSLFYRVFEISRVRSLIINWLLPLVFIVLAAIMFENITGIDFNITLTISSIILGFNASIITMLITVNNNTTDRLKNTKLKNTTYNMHEGLIYKFGYVVLILALNILLTVITYMFSFDYTIIKLISTYLIINSILVMLEAISELIFVYSK